MREIKIIGVASKDPESEDWEIDLEDEDLVIELDEEDFKEEVISMVPDFSSPSGDSFHEVSSYKINEFELWKKANELAYNLMRDMGYVDYDFYLE